MVGNQRFPEEGSMIGSRWVRRMRSIGLYWRQSVGRRDSSSANGATGRRRRFTTLLATPLAIVVLGAVGAAPAQAEPMPNGVPGTWQLRLNEEFTGAGLNTALWTPSWH